MTLQAAENAGAGPGVAATNHGSSGAGASSGREQMHQMLQELTAALQGLQPATILNASSSSDQHTAEEGSALSDASLQSVLQQHGLGAAQLQGVSGLLQVGRGSL
jgi:hypothetical protein